jgi:hypothetical protein
MAITKEILDELFKDYQKPADLLARAAYCNNSPKR